MIDKIHFHLKFSFSLFFFFQISMYQTCLSNWLDIMKEFSFLFLFFSSLFFFFFFRFCSRWIAVIIKNFWFLFGFYFLISVSSTLKTVPSDSWLSLTINNSLVWICIFKQRKTNNFFLHETLLLINHFCSFINRFIVKNVS